MPNRYIYILVAADEASDCFIMGPYELDAEWVILQLVVYIEPWFIKRY